MNVFGRVGKVAKGVGGALLKAAAAPGPEESLDAEIEGLLHRVSEGHHAEDRREAMAGLRDALQGGGEAAQASNRAFRCDRRPMPIAQALVVSTSSLQRLCQVDCIGRKIQHGIPLVSHC